MLILSWAGQEWEAARRQLDRYVHKRPAQKTAKDRAAVPVGMAAAHMTHRRGGAGAKKEEGDPPSARAPDVENRLE